MYSYSDIKKICVYGRQEKIIREEYSELLDIKDFLNSIFCRTAFFSDYIDDKTSYITISYIIDLFKSIKKEDLNLIDHHLIDTFTYPYNHQAIDVINGLNSIFRPNDMENTNDYINSFNRVFSRLISIHAADIKICKYNKLDLLVDCFTKFMVNTPTKREYYAFLQLIIAYLYRNINNYDEDKIIYIFDTLFNNEYYLSKIRLNTNVPLNQILDYDCRYLNKEDLLNTYNLAIYTVDNIIMNKEINSIKKVIK